MQCNARLRRRYWTLALVLTGVMSPLLGKIYAALGARMMIAVAGGVLPAAARALPSLLPHAHAGPLFALTVASMGRITNGHLLIVLFWALRILMSVYDLVFKVSVPMWFVKRRGTAIAISSLMSSSMLAYPSGVPLSPRPLSPPILHCTYSRSFVSSRSH